MLWYLLHTLENIHILFYAAPHRPPLLVYKELQYRGEDKSGSNYVPHLTVQIEVVTLCMRTARDIESLLGTRDKELT